MRSAPYLAVRARASSRPVFLPVLLLAALSAGGVPFARTAAGGERPPLRYPPDRPVDVERLRLDLDVDLQGRTVRGSATLAGRTIAPQVTEISLDAKGLAIQAVRDGAGRALAFRSTGEKLLVRPEPPLERRGEPFELAIEYAVVRPPLGSGGLWFYGPTDGEPGTPLELWTQGESAEARSWFPCVDTPEERQEIEVVARVPAGLEALSNGALIERSLDEAAGKARFHFRQAIAVPAYLVTLVVGRFAVIREDWQGIPVTFYVPPGREEDAARSFGETRAMLDFFSKRIGVRYPFEKYAQVCVEQFCVSGMENSSATTLTDRTLHDARADLDESSEPLVAHELAHQWWGDLLTCRDWRDIWLNEGFATFFEACWDEERNGADAYAYNMLEKAGGALAGGRDTPLVRRRYHDPGETFGGGTYPKGAWVLHMLRRELGEECFWAGIRRYAETYREKAVESGDFRRAMERETGRSLGRFFDQWLERPGHPVLAVAAGWRDGEKLLEVNVRQTQAGEPFQFTTEVAVAPDSPGGAVRTFPLTVERKEERLLIPLAARPRWLSFDPRQAVLRETTLEIDRDQLFFALAEDPSVSGRIDALRALARSGAADAIAAVGRALSEDRFSGVRAAAAEALGGAPGEAARDALLQGLAANRPAAPPGTRGQAEVRHAIVTALGGYHKDAKVAGALAALLAAGDPSYSVEAAAARSLARTQDARAFGVLVSLLERPSYGEQIRVAAIDGFAELSGVEGIAPARQWAARGKPREVREAALRALGRLGARKETPESERAAVSQMLAAALEERAPRIRGAAIDGLRELGAELALPALDALAVHEPDGGLRERARAAAERIRAGAPPDAEMARLREEYRRLADENRALGERLERLEARSGEEGKGRRPPAPAEPR